MKDQHPSQFAADVRRLAEDAYDSGLYCAEAVVAALAKAQGFDAKQVTRTATAFCGGMSRTCGQCGALTGAIMGLSLGLGRSDARQSANAAFAATHELVRQFENEFGGRNCDQLLGCDLGTPEGQAMFKEQALHTRCQLYTARAAEFAAELLAKNDG
jgi:C_GCAxxG_C_C family probable redox protein